MQHTMIATLVGAEARPYREFTDNTGKTVAAGHAYRLHLSERFDAAPIDVRCSRAEYDRHASLGSGAQVDVVLDVLASNNQLGYRLVELNPVAALKVAA